jgi:hypothetical protein
MAIRILTSAVLSAIAMFVWGFVFWGPVLNMTSRLMKPLPAEQELDVLAPLRVAKLADGMYVYPGPLADQNDAAAAEAWKKKIEDGPILQLSYRGAGTSPMDPMMFAEGLGHSFLIALLAAAALSMAAPALPAYGQRATLVMIIVLIGALWTNVGNMIWWGHSPAYTAGQVAYHLGAGLLMAAITAAIIKPRLAAIPVAAK